MQGHMGGKRGGVAGREHEAAKGGYSLTGHDILGYPITLSFQINWILDILC